ncbi:MAG: CapA family protein [Deltaproteobacteria bacterium]|nr:CapA family protein [Deltaproteobacteria bacterium]
MIPWILGCDPYAEWPAEGSYFPYAYTPESELQDYETVRWETESWTPEDDADQLALYLLKAQDHKPAGVAEVEAHFAAQSLPAPGDGQSISLAGDVMWVGDNWSSFAVPVADLLDGDLRVGNLETPVSSLHSTEPGALGLYAFNAPSDMLEALPFDALQLNNNHSLDAGDEGLAATVSAVRSAGYVATGVDGQATVGNVALISYTWGTNVREPSAHELYIEPFGHVEPEIDWDRVARDLAVEARWKVVLLHWGYEYEYFPEPQFMQQAREFIARGADLVVGQGPHVVQPAEICHVNDPSQVPGVGTCSLRTADGEPRTAAVIYSLGNFATSMATIPCQVGVIATVTLGSEGVTGLAWEPVATVDGPSVVPLASLTGEEYLAEAARLEEHLGGWGRR